MNCKCGNELQWEDGAFCKECMAEAAEKIRRKKNESFIAYPSPCCGAESLVKRVVSYAGNLMTCGQCGRAWQS